MSKTFFDFFPTPEFLSMPSAGLSILGSNISFIELTKQKNGGVALKKYGSEIIPDSVLDGSDIKKPEELIKILSGFKEKYNLSFIKTALPEEKAFLFRTTMPKMSGPEVREALRFKIEENVPLSAEESQFDFRIVSDAPSENRKDKTDKKEDTLQIVVSVVSKETVQKYLDIFKKSGLNPVSFELESQSLAKSIIKKGDGGAFILVNALGGKIGLYIVDQELVQFTSTVTLSDTVLSSLSSPHKENLRSQFPDKKTTSSERQNKNEFGVGENKARIYTKSTDGDKTLKSEMENMIAYWKSFIYREGGRKKIGNPEINKIIICGEKDIRLGLENYFSSYFSIPVGQADVWVNTFSLKDYVPDLSFEESFKYAVSVGLALPF